MVELLNAHDQQLLLGHFPGIWKQNAFEEAEKPGDEPKEGTVTVSKLNEGLQHIDASIKEFEHSDFSA